MTLERMMLELQYKEEIEQAVLRKIYGDEKVIIENAKTAYTGDDFDFALCRCMPLTRLAVVTYLLLGKYDEYRKHGIPDDIIFDTFRDVALRAGLYYEKTGKAGISKEDVIWFRHIINVGIFKIGVLQFQPFEMVYLDEDTIGEPYMTFSRKQKEILPGGTTVLNCHIQQGADLSPQSVRNSFKRAKHFFNEHFPDVQYKAFLCYSWMLYPPMLKHLSDESKIKQFAANFSIIGSCPDSEQATDYIFSKKSLSTNVTWLQKFAYEHKELLGFGCGIIEYCFCGERKYGD